MHNFRPITTPHGLSRVHALTRGSQRVSSRVQGDSGPSIRRRWRPRGTRGRLHVWNRSRDRRGRLQSPPLSTLTTQSLIASHFTVCSRCEMPGPVGRTKHPPTHPGHAHHQSCEKFLTHLIFATCAPDGLGEHHLCGRRIPQHRPCHPRRRGPRAPHQRAPAGVVPTARSIMQDGAPRTLCSVVALRWEPQRCDEAVRRGARSVRLHRPAHAHLLITRRSSSPRNSTGHRPRAVRDSAPVAGTKICGIASTISTRTRTCSSLSGRAATQ